MPWEWYATFTLPAGSTTTVLHRCLEQWRQRLESEFGRELRLAVGIEPQRNGTPHAHALIHHVSPRLGPSYAGRVWEQISRGFARIKPYIPRGGAASYVAKVARSDSDSILLLGPWPSGWSANGLGARSESKEAAGRRRDDALDPWIVPPDNPPQRVADKRRHAMRLSALFEEFCQYLRVETEAAQSTIGTYRWCFKDFVEFATQDVGGTVLTSHFTADRCRAYQYELVNARKLQPGSVRLRLATLGSFSKWAVRRRRLAENPIELLTRPRRRTRLPRVPHWDTVKDVLRQSGPRDRAIIALMAYGGLRRSEVVSLDIGDYAPAFGLRRVCGKGGHEASVPLPEVAREIVSDYLAKERADAGRSEPMFVVRYRSVAGAWVERRMSAQRVWKLVKELGRRAGVPDLHPHAFRHACGVELLRLTDGKLRAVQEHLRHSDIQTTTAYTRLTQQDLRKVVSVFDRDGR